MRFVAALGVLCALAVPARAAQGGKLTVFAASSLKEAFTELGARFESEHPAWKVSFQFAGSQELRAQLKHGARADLFASADWAHLEEVEAQPAHVFARNALVVVVPRGGKLRVPTFAELPLARSIVLGSPDVPVGRYSQQVLDRAATKYGPEFREQVLGAVKSRELNVRQVLAKVSLGEADAGLVYRTDVAAAKGKVEEVPIPHALNVTAEYPAAVLTGAKQPKQAGGIL